MSSLDRSKHYPLLNAGDADALVIHCVDPRFQTAFRRFISEELGIQNPIPVIIPGGIHDLVSPARIKAARHLKEQLDFIIKNNRIKRVVLLNHEGCLWYGKWNSLVATTIGHDLAGHLLSAAETLIEKRLGIEVECYLARMEGQEVVFNRVDRKYAA